MKPQLEIRGSKGVNNIDAYLAKDEVAKATNVDVDGNGSLLLRGGYTRKMTGSYHSVFSHVNGTVLAVKVDSLVLFDATAFTETVLLAGLAIGSRMSYAVVGDKTYYSNGQVIGYVKAGIRYDLPDPGIQYKAKMPAGHILVAYRARMYSAVGDTLYFSDAAAYERYTVSPETQAFKKFAGWITLLIAMQDGLYVSDGLQTFFMSGASPEEMSITIVDPAPAIANTSAYVERGTTDGITLRSQPLAKPTAIWTSTRGICLGLDSGNLKNITEKKYARNITELNNCSGFFRETINTKIPQYIFTEAN